MLNYIKFNGNTMKFEEYWTQIEKFISLNDYEKFKLCFEILDYDGDGRLSISDILSIMHKQQETDLLNMNDWELILKYLKQPSILSNLASK